jgi:hypothetical protein
MVSPQLCILKGNNSLGILPAFAVAAIPTLITGVASIFTSNYNARAAKAQANAVAIQAQSDAAERKKLYLVAGGAGFALITLVLITKRNKSNG